MKRLNELQEGQVGTISGIAGDARFQSRAVAIGMVVGGEVRVLRNEGKMPLLVYSRDSMIALHQHECLEDQGQLRRIEILGSACSQCRKCLARQDATEGLDWPLMWELVDQGADSAWPEEGIQP